MSYIPGGVKYKMEYLHGFESPLEVSVGVGLSEGSDGSGQQQAVKACSIMFCVQWIYGAILK